MRYDTKYTLYLQLGANPKKNCKISERENKSHFQSSFTVSDWALIFPSPILSQLQGWHWCQKIQKNVLQINLLSFCARIELKLSKLQKIIKTEEKVIKNLCFLLVFWNLCNLSLILAQKTTKF